MRFDRWFVRRARYDVSVRVTDMQAEYIEQWNKDQDGWEIERAALQAQIPTEKTPVTQGQYDSLKASRCLHCGGSHAISCPRVKRIRFRPDGQTPVEVEFWGDCEWSKDRVVWLEDLIIETVAPQ